MNAVLLSIVAALSAGLPALAQSSQKSPADASTQPAVATSGPGETTTRPVDAITPDVINAKIKQIQEQQGLDEAVKNKALEIYNEALGWLTKADVHVANLAEIEKQRAEAPGTPEEITEMASKPVPPAPAIDAAPDAKLEDLEKELKQHEAEFKAATDRQASITTSLANHRERMKTIPEEIAKARKELDDLSNALLNSGAVDDPAEVAAAKRVERLAHGREREKALAFLNAESNRTPLLEALVKYAEWESAKFEKQFKAWQDFVNERRRMEAEAAAAKAKNVEQQAKQSDPVIAGLATENAELAKRRTEIADEIASIGERVTAIEKDYNTITERQQKIRERVEKAGLSPQLALLLRRYREQLPNLRDLRSRLQKRREELAEVEVRQFEISELIVSNEEMKAAVRERAAKLDKDIPKEEKEALKAEIKSLLIARNQYATDLKTDYDVYFEKLGAVEKGLVDRQQALLEAAESFAAYVNEHILWIRSTKPPQFGKGENENDIENFLEAVAWFFGPKKWGQVWAGFVELIDQNRIESALGFLLFVAAIVIALRLRRLLVKTGQTISKSYAAIFSPTVEAFVITFAIALVGPLLLYIVGWMIGAVYDAPEFSKSVSRGITVIALQWFGIAVLRRACAPTGLVEAHFNWPARLVKRIRRACSALLLIGLPCIFIVAVLEWEPKDIFQRTLGRLAFVVAQINLCVFLYRVLHPNEGALEETNLLEKPGWKRRFALLAFYAIVALPIGLSILSLMGYYYTAIEIAIRFQRMVWMSTGVILLYGLGLRWLLVSRRKLAIEQARQRRAAAEAEQQAAVEAEAEGTTQVVEARIEPQPDPEIDLSSLNVQTRAILRGVAIVALSVGLWFVWVDVIPALRYFDRFELWSTMQNVTETREGPNGAVTQTVEKNVPVTLGDLGVALLIVAAAFLAVRNLHGVIEIGILRKTDLGAGERYAIITISKYVIMVLGFMGAFNAIGVGWSQVQWLAAAITVGLGFGLQEIFANFVSGLIILFERPIRVGDVVTVSGMDGRVTRIQMRATTVLNWDRKEIIIPNKEFVTGQVINWTLSDELTRVQVPVGIAYGSDTRLARDLILKVAAENAYVLKDPAPQVVFDSFGASSLDFILRCHVKDLPDGVLAKDTLHYEIDDAFRKANIEISFPQMDVHLRDVPKELHAAGEATESAPQ